MMTDIDIYTKLASLPESLKKEVNDFVDFLKAKLVTKRKAKPQRQSGLAKGLIKMKDNFDEPLDDFKDYTY